jgi:hypothetical protein
MLDILERIVPSRRQPLGRSRATAFRLNLERLERRELLTIPLPPTGVVAKGISASAIALTWNPDTGTVVTGYNVTEKFWVSGGRTGGGIWHYNPIVSNLKAASYTVTGLATGTHHIYVITAVNSAGKSFYSLPATGQTWFAPVLRDGPNYYELSDGALATGPITATAGLTTQIDILAAGNPLKFSVVSGPTTVSINATTGLLTFTPAASEVGAVNVKVQASNALGTVAQTVQFTVAANSSLPRPKLALTASSTTFNFQDQQATATAVGTDGVTPVNGTFAYAYDGYPGPVYNAAKYQVLVTFTSSDPHYGNATLLTTFTVFKAAPTFSYLQSNTITKGDTPVVASGYIGVGNTGPNIHTPVGEYVIVTLNGVTQAAPIQSNGAFSTTFDTSSLTVGSYTMTYVYPGDGAEFTNAPRGITTLKVIPQSPPVVTANPSNATTTAGDPVGFTASAAGSDAPTVQWEMSTDGGQTWTTQGVGTVTTTTTATGTTTTLSFFTTATENGYEFRVVFTNELGTVRTSAAILTVEQDSGGDT